MLCSLPRVSNDVQGNRFTCPTEPMNVKGTPPASVTDGLSCYTSTSGSAVASASLADLTAHPITEYLKFSGVHGCKKQDLTRLHRSLHKGQLDDSHAKLMSTGVRSL